MTMGTRMATAAVSAEALPSRPETPAEETWLEIRPKAKKPPMRNQATEAAERHQERRARRPLLEREDQSADRGDIVIGGSGKTALRRRARRTPGANELRGRRGGAWRWRLGELQRRLRRLLGRRFGGSSRFGSRALALALLGLEPFRQRGSLGKVEAPLRGGLSPGFSSRDRVIASRGFCVFGPRCLSFRTATSLALAPSRVPRNRRKLMREFARLATRYRPAAAPSVIDVKP